ncbi:MAG: zinc-ribbon domain-containing protein [Rhodobacter sp.]|nr:zinc-ribbon domain-containing protein [Rhodobacter sp.]
MRLICPNCGAQYEVDDDVIPEAGRDVQCSNCGHTWFQRPAHMDADLADELDQPPPVEDAAMPEPGDAPAPEPRELDPEVAGVLREEAERETAARKADAEGLETQPDLGLEDADAVAAQRSAAARARMARLRGLDDDTDAAPAAAPAGSRRELLPDIDEINSTLRASEDREEGAPAGVVVAEEAAAVRRRGGFRTGFLLIAIVAAVAVAVYSFAPQIVEQVPQAEPYLATYVDWANTLRDQINTGVETSVAKINELIASFSEGGEG